MGRQRCSQHKTPNLRRRGFRRGRGKPAKNCSSSLKYAFSTSISIFSWAVKNFFRAMWEGPAWASALNTFQEHGSVGHQLCLVEPICGLRSVTLGTCCCHSKLHTG